jgi:hypothetical protein
MLAISCFLLPKTTAPSEMNLPWIFLATALGVKRKPGPSPKERGFESLFVRDFYHRGTNPASATYFCPFWGLRTS